MFSGSAIDLVMGAVFTLLLAAACVTDLRSRRIPNELVAVLLATGLLNALLAPDVVLALVSSLAGMVLGFVIWILFYLAGAIGAGDVKLFAAAAAWLGPAATWRAALIAAVLGGVLAVGFLIADGRLGSTLRRMALAVSSGTLALVADTQPPAVRRKSLPYGVALAIGALITAWFPGLS